MRWLPIAAYQGVREARLLHSGPAPTPLTAAPDERPVVRRWCEWLTPVDDQGNTGTCVAQAATRVLEWALHFYARVYVQLDALAVYRRAWEMEHKARWPGDRAYADGLKVDSAVRALVDLGALPRTAFYEEVPCSVPAIAAALEKGPLLAASCVHSGWYDWDRATGEIAAAKPVLNGHAWVLHALDWGRTGRPLVGGVNSWGEDWGYRGTFWWWFDNFYSCAVARPGQIGGVPSWHEWYFQHAKAIEPLIIEGQAEAA